MVNTNMAERTETKRRREVLFDDGFIFVFQSIFARNHPKYFVLLVRIIIFIYTTVYISLNYRFIYYIM